MTGAALTGFFTSLSLILAIGAQNAFVLRQGLTREHVFALCLFCALSDALLIAAGVAGFGIISAAWPGATTALILAGAAFLVVYGAMRLRSALTGGNGMHRQGQGRSVWQVLALAAAMTWLNPHVYLDTLGLIGAVSAGFAPGAPRMGFAIGAVTASFLFFFTLGYGARRLAPIMASARAWRILDLAIALLMWTIAATLLLKL
ncbi:LysE/ArgO family amino acid transporter [Rhodovulum adriaticum]|uniref:L-lysine exporter family protein LysE/ArgO n=1 Tax=Rhodovulum adriaticum TaxID=35804 RepID=A0A4R2NTS9_RHOAD|nr:LysE/ArgO family amino acid transporter [Rhodovulum adriaticum]MBK1635088.1 amino acid transporter [Rhodovulum adriaticum]TCP25277.1 L-lysine exporter family protein LysE/ArgO [Rhodovulum adriaticum]